MRVKNINIPAVPARSGLEKEPPDLSVQYIFRPAADKRPRVKTGHPESPPRRLSGITEEPAG